MTTFTQERQPYGRIMRREFEFEGTRYVVRCDPTQYTPGRYRWELRSAPLRAGEYTKREMYCDLPFKARMHEAVGRFLGREFADQNVSERD